MSDFRPHQSSFETEDLSRVVKTDDQWFRPVDIKAGPDGGIYIADMYEQRIDHSSHYAGRVDRSSGRIYRLHRKTKPESAPFEQRGLNLSTVAIATVNTDAGQYSKNHSTDATEYFS